MIDVKTKINSFFIFNSSFGPREGDVSMQMLLPLQLSIKTIIDNDNNLITNTKEIEIKFANTLFSPHIPYIVFYSV